MEKYGKSAIFEETGIPASGRSLVLLLPLILGGRLLRLRGAAA